MKFTTLYQYKMGLLDKYNEEPKESVSITLDVSVVKRLREMRKEKKLKSVSPLINDLIVDWLNKLDQETKELKEEK